MDPQQTNENNLIYGKLSGLLLGKFLDESNMIEGITKPLSLQEFMNAALFLASEVIRVDLLRNYLNIIQPDARLRSLPTDPNVCIGNHKPPLSGPAVHADFMAILEGAHDGDDPQEIHIRYEKLHPFTDGNGRTGRLIWLWQMIHHHDYDGRNGFLIQWYYSSLAK